MIKVIRAFKQPLGGPTRFGWLSFLSPFGYRKLGKYKPIRLFKCKDWWFRIKRTQYDVGILIEVRVAGIELANMSR